MPDLLSRCLAAVPLGDGLTAYLYLQLAAVPEPYRARARRDATGKAWVLIA